MTLVVIPSYYNVFFYLNLIEIMLFYVHTNYNTNTEMYRLTCPCLTFVENNVPVLHLCAIYVSCFVNMLGI